LSSYFIAFSPTALSPAEEWYLTFYCAPFFALRPKNDPQGIENQRLAKALIHRFSC
jgi:hypothetical protein